MAVSTILTIVGALISVRLGQKMAEDAAKAREQRELERQSGAVKILLKLEIDQNLKALTDVWEWYQQTEQYASSLAGIPQPQFSWTVWESQIGVMTVAFDENMLARIAYFYRSLIELTRLHGSLIELRNHDRFSAATAPEWTVGSHHTGMRVQVIGSVSGDHALKIANRWEQLVTELLADANPLRRWDSQS